MQANFQIGQFVFERHLGEGGMAEVWLGRNVHLDSPVAIKFLNAQFADNTEMQARFLAEGRHQSELDHPNIVKVFACFQQEGRNYLVLQYIAGEPLDLRLQRTGPLSSADFYRITEGVLSALDYAHSKRLVHRDVKPSNILLDPGGNAYLGDFGLVLAFDQQGLTRTGTTMGTPPYMSPEQISDPATVDHRSDIYSLGCVMYEMLTGRPPFDDSVGGFEVKLAHVQQPPPPPRFWNPQIPVALEQVVLQCLAKQPAQRFSSCKELYKALWATPPVKPPEEYERRGFLGVALAGLAALTVAGGGGAWYWTRCCSAPRVEPRPVQKEPEKADRKTTELERQPVIQRPVIQGEEGRKQELLPPDRELPKTQATPKREEPREPVPKREIVPAPELPLSGSLTWSGPVSKNDRITITGSTASKGTVSGDPMPADRWLEVNLNNKDYGVAEAPTVSNGNRITLRASKKGDGRVTINWSTVR